MREDVLSLQAMGGDRVSEQYLKAELYHRAEALKDIRDTPLFFGRLDYAEPSETGQSASGKAASGKAASGKAASGNYGSEVSGPVQSADDGVAGHSFHIGRR